jgi:hypothetical protein
MRVAIEFRSIRIRPFDEVSLGALVTKLSPPPKMISSVSGIDAGEVFPLCTTSRRQPPRPKAKSVSGNWSMRRFA